MYFSEFLSSFYVYILWHSVRSTNVYEERSLGVFDDENEFEEPSSEGSRVHVWGRYIAWHARKQLAFGKCFNCSQ